MATRIAPEPRDNDSTNVFISLRGSYYEVKLTRCPPMPAEACALPWLDGAGNLEKVQVYEQGLSYEKA